MEDRELAEDDPTAADDDPTTAEEPKLLGVIPLKVALLVVVVLPIVGYLVGMIGSGSSSTTVPVDLVIGPQNASGALQPGTTSQFTVLVENPTEDGVRVSSIDAGASEATSGGCPAGAVTSEEVDGPPGYISPGGVLAFRVTATMAATARDECSGQSFTLPLNVELVSAG